MEPADLTGRSIVVAGATGAVGGALARELTARGAVVGVLGRNRGRLDAIADELGGVPSAVFDAHDVASCHGAVDALAAALGGLDGLLVATGAVAFGSARETPDHIVHELLTVNALGPIALLRAAAAHLEDGGRLAVVSAMVADYPTAGMAAYSASKAALSAYLTALRRELRRARVTVLDARLPHLDTGFETRALAGTPPKLPDGRSVVEVAELLVDAFAAGRTDVAWDLKARELVVS